MSSAQDVVPDILEPLIKPGELPLGIAITTASIFFTLLLFLWFKLCYYPGGYKRRQVMDMGEYALIAGARRFREEREKKQKQMLGVHKDELYIENPPGSGGADGGGGGGGVGGGDTRGTAAYSIGLSYGPPSYFHLNQPPPFSSLPPLLPLAQPSDPAAVLASAGVPDHIASIGRHGTGSSLTESSGEDTESQS
ncbi:unnamed protein product, partial [Closterium sp. NIES-54]